VFRHIPLRRDLFASAYHGHWGLRLLGITGADGIVRGHIPTPAESNLPREARVGPQPMRVSKPGHDWQFKDVGRGGEFEFRLRPGHATAVSVDGAEGRLVQFRALGTIHVRTEGNSAFSSPLPIEAERGEAGVWSVSGTAAGFTPRLSLSGAVPTAAVADFVGKQTEQSTIDLGACTVDVRVVGVDATPAPAGLGIGRVTGGHPLYWDAVLATDVGGRAELRLPAGEFFVYATTGGAHALALVDQASRNPLSLQLETVPTMRVRVLDADARPVAGAGALPAGSAGGAGADPLTKVWGYLSFEMCVNYLTQARSDADGVLQIPAFVRAGVGVSVRVRAGQRTSQPFLLVPDGINEVTVRD
jgi:hypothetical protein